MKTLRFLGWSAPLPELAAPLLLREGVRYGNSADLSDLLVLIPGREAVRVLTEMMTDLLASCSGGLFPPEFRTPEQFLLEGGEAVSAATPLEQLRAWRQVLSECGKQEFPTLFPLDFSRRGDSLIDQLALQFRLLKRELSAGGLTMAEIARSGVTLDTERWEEIAELERRYTDLLASAKRTDPEDLKRTLANDPSPFRRYRKILVLALPDPSHLLLKRLGKAAETMDVELWINAPKEAENRFDGWGRPRPEIWENEPLDLGSISADPQTDDLACHLFQTETIEQMAVTAAALLARGPRPDLASRTVALTDDSLFDALRRELSRLRIRGSGGRSLIVTSPAGEPMQKLRLSDPLNRLRAFLAADEFESLHELFRHEDFLAAAEQKLGISRETILDRLDDFRMKHLPETLDQAFQYAEPDLLPILHFLRELKERMETLAPADAVEAFLRLLYDGREDAVSSGIPLKHELREFRSLLEIVRRSPLFRNDSLRSLLPELLQIAGNIRLYREPLENEFQVGGFLDLPWSRKKEIILCGMNDGAIPENVHGSTFLSDTMREKLNLPCNRRRLGRDALYLESLLRSRGRGHLWFLASRFDSSDRPLKYSRFFFQCGSRDLFDRASILFEPVRFPEPPVRPSAGEAFHLEPDFHRAEKGGDLVISVTRFKEYLQSPFRFFLSVCLGMKETDYDPVELNRAEFGSCCHSALERLGKTPPADPEELRRRLFEALDSYMCARYGAPLPPLIAIQNEQMKQRLSWAATTLADALVGFRGLECEYKLGGEMNAGVEFDGAIIQGRIDRIDYSPSQNLLRLIDYKTTDSGKSPEADHYQSGNKTFINLQLPLYRMLIVRDARFREAHPEIDFSTVRILCGYLTMPTSVTNTSLLLWEGMDALLPEAERTVRNVLRGIRSMKEGIFRENPDLKIKYDIYKPYLLPDLRHAVPSAKWLSAEENP